MIAIGSVVTFVMADFQSSLEEKQKELEQKQRELEQKQSQLEAEQLAKEQKERELEQKCRELERLLLTVKVDKMSYQTGDIIRVSGTGPGGCEETPIAIQVFNPRNTMYTIGQTTPSSDGIYSFEEAPKPQAVDPPNNKQFFLNFKFFRLGDLKPFSLIWIV